MLNLRRKIPPLSALIAFEACARHLSFTRAADELGVTQVAVSRQIKTLEDYVGVKLFDRLHRAIRLNAAGNSFREALVPSLTRIAECVDGLQKGEGGNRLTVGTTTGFSAYWLMPRIAKFSAQYPEVELRFAVDDKCVELKASGIDLSVRYGSGSWPGLSAQFLCSSHVRPLCAPSYWGNRPVTDDPRDLLGEVLVDFDYVVDSSWGNWFAHMGVELEKDPATITTNAYTSMVQTIQNGNGIALLSAPLIQDLLNSDALMEPTSLPPQELPGGYYLVQPRGAEQCAARDKFVDWIRGEMKEAEAPSGAQPMPISSSGPEASAS